MPVITWLCSRVMRLQSRPINWPLLTIESPVAQWLEHPTRSQRVVGSNPIWGSDFFRVLQTFNLSCVCCFIFNIISKITKEIFAKICWQLKITTQCWKCTRFIMEMSYLYASDFPFKHVCKLVQHAETIRKIVWEKRDDAYSSIRVQTTITIFRFFRFYVFYHNINVKAWIIKRLSFYNPWSKQFFFRARAQKGFAQHTDASSMVGT